MQFYCSFKFNGDFHSYISFHRASITLTNYHQYGHFKHAKTFSPLYQENCTILHVDMLTQNCTAAKFENLIFNFPNKYVQTIYINISQLTSISQHHTKIVVAVDAISATNCTLFRVFCQDFSNQAIELVSCYLFCCIFCKIIYKLIIYISCSMVRFPLTQSFF